MGYFYTQLKSYSGNQSGNVFFVLSLFFHVFLKNSQKIQVHIRLKAFCINGAK